MTEKLRAEKAEETVIAGRSLYEIEVLLTWMLDALQAAEKRAEKAEAENLKTLSMIRHRGVSETRAKTLHHALEVLLYRLNREISSLEAENARLEGENARLWQFIERFAPEGMDISEEAVLPPGNKDPRSDEINPNGIDYGIFKGESNG